MRPRGSRGFSCVAVAGHGARDMLLAGTAGGQLMGLDLERREAASQMLCTPSGLRPQVRFLRLRP